MITVRFFGESPCQGFYAGGHAGTAPYGQDLVCAAVSALTQGALFALKHYQVRFRYRQEDDNGVLCCLVREEDSGRLATSDVILTSLREGLLAVQSQFPQCLRVIPR